jgi:hypothetical protein
MLMSTRGEALDQAWKALREAEAQAHADQGGEQGMIIGGKDLRCWIGLHDFTPYNDEVMLPIGGGSFEVKKNIRVSCKRFGCHAETQGKMVAMLKREPSVG